MGDMYGKVKLWGLNADGTHAGSATVLALLDTGATVSVIDSETAAKLAGQVSAHGDQLEGRPVKTMNVSMKLNAVDCGTKAKHIVVSDRLVAKIGNKNAKMILGSDYMQRTRLSLGMSTEKGDEFVGCRAGKPPKPKATKRGVTAEARPSKKRV